MKENRSSSFSRRSFIYGLAALPAVRSTFASTRTLAHTAGDILATAGAAGFQGVVLLARRDRVRFLSTTGIADAARGIGLTPDASFCIASISKRLTTVAVMRLIEQNKLALDAPIVAYLPDYREDTGAKITLRHLLSNSSGIPNAFTDAARKDPSLTAIDLPTNEAVRRFASGDLAFEPGTRFDYSPTNWILVTAILEAVTEKPYAQTMQDLVLTPLGMTNTQPNPPPNAAMSYRSLTPTAVAWDPQPLGRYSVASGGYYSTARDLLTFADAVYGGKILSAASLRALTHIEMTSDAYALGGRVRSIIIDGQSRNAAWDTGNVAGYRSVVGCRLDGGDTVVILNNTGVSQRTLDELADALLQALAAN